MTQVAIIGAGPAGAALALILASRQIRTTLIERRRDFAREFRGEILMPSGISALASIGVTDIADKVPTFTPGNFSFYLNTQRLLTLDLEPDWFAGTPPMAISQPAFLEYLIDKALATGYLHFLRGASVRSLMKDSDRVTGLTYEDDAGEQDLPADLVIGCDGRNSLLRRMLDLGVAAINTPMDIVWFKVPCPDAFNGVRAYAGRGHLLIAYKTWDGNLQIGWIILKGYYKTVKGEGTRHWLQEMERHVTDDLAEHLAANRSALEHPFLLVSESNRVTRWSRPGALVIGDAAHTMSPVGGQGINIALRDSIVAANYLVPLLQGNTIDHNLLDTALIAIETERVREVAPVQQFQAQPPKLVLNSAWWSEPVRSIAGLALANASDGLRARAASRLKPLLFGLTDVKLEV